MKTCLVAALLTVGAASSVLAAEPQFGRWAAESQFCAIGKTYKADHAGERLAVTWNGERSDMKRCP